MKLKKTLAGIGILIPILLLLAAVFGWASNIVKLFQADAIAGMEVARGFGILFAPIGAVLGYF